MLFPPLLSCINLAENIIGFTCQTVAIVLYSNLLYRIFFDTSKVKVDRLPSLMLMYIISHWFWCIVTIPYNAYMALMWRTDHNAYYPYTMFWFGMSFDGYLVANPLQVLFLTLDRYLILKYAENYNARQRKVLFISCIFAVILLVLVIFAINLMEFPLNLAKVKDCTSFPCLMIKSKMLHINYSKVVIGTLNVVLGIGFFVALKWRNSKQIKNRIVTVTLLAEIFFNVLPGYCTSLFNSISGDNIANYLGQFVSMFLACDALFCSIIYSKIFLRRRDSKTPTIKVFTVSTRPSVASSK